jgi:hypothetical protein
LLEQEHERLRGARREFECLGPVAGVSNAMPPINTDKIDWVWTLRPLADNDTSIPLAFQNRVLWLTYWS